MDSTPDILDTLNRIERTLARIEHRLDSGLKSLEAKTESVERLCIGDWLDGLLEPVPVMIGGN